MTAPRFTLIAGFLLFMPMGAVAGPPDLRPAEMGTDSQLPVATFSIVAFDEENREWGIAVQSKFIAVGSVVPWAAAEVGAIATQSYANTTYGPEGLKLLEEGLSAQEALDELIAGDPRKERRQVGIVDSQGRAATFTGSQCVPWAGGRTGRHYAVQGNILAGEEVVDRMAEAFEQSEGDLGDRLIAALAAGQASGGDKRGKQSAALLIVREKAGYAGLNDRYRDLRVDDHSEPIEELRRIYRLHRDVFAPPKKLAEEEPALTPSEPAQR